MKTNSKVLTQNQSPLVEGEDFYLEGAVMVFTARFHIQRGSCCGNGCRHCPYQPKHHAGAKARLKAEGERRKE